MIGYLKGKVLSLTPETALILTDSGVGFEVLVSGSAFDGLAVNKECGLYTYMQVREDGVSLFGFTSAEEKEMYLRLISVSGVGPKLGISVLSCMSAGEVAAAIATSDIKRLSSVKGLGKKTAERLVLELREKVSVKQSGENIVPAVQVRTSEGDEDAVVALMTLGFSRSESVKAIARAHEQGAVLLEDVIRLALKGM